MNDDKLRALFCLVLPPKSSDSTDSSVISYAEKFKYVGTPLYILVSQTPMVSINVSIHCDKYEFASEVIRESPIF